VVRPVPAASPRTSREAQPGLLYPDNIDSIIYPGIIRFAMATSINHSEPAYTAFIGERRAASGALRDVALAVKSTLRPGASDEILIFDDESARAIEIDFSGVAADVEKSAERALAAAGVSEAAPRGPGRPKLGVVAREVTLLPRHWAWLAAQPGGASVALRKLVEEASRDKDGRDRRRRAQERTYRFLSAMAGDRPHFEEAARALFAGSRQKFLDLTQAWPKDIAVYAHALSEGAFEQEQ
jgi:uncharacterized protein